MLIFLFLVPYCFAQDETKNCPSNLIRGPALKAHDGRCYEFVTHHRQDWEGAKHDCNSKGGNLVVIRSLADNKFIMDALRELNFHGTNAWIGLSDKVTEGSFQWSTGEASNFQYWGSGQPATFIQGQVEDCVVLKYTDSGHWHDYPCTSILLLPENYPWICEYGMETLIEATTLPDREFPPTTHENIAIIG